MARSYIKNSEIFLQPGWTDVKGGGEGGVGLSVKMLGGVGVNVFEDKGGGREIFLQQKSCSLTVIIRQRQHAAAAAASSTGSSGSSGRGWRAARAAAAGSTAAVQAAAHVACGSCGGSGGCGGTSGAGCRCRIGG